MTTRDRDPGLVDAELLARLHALLRGFLVPIVAEALREVVSGEYIDRDGAHALGVEWRTLRRSELQSFRVGRKVVYRRADVVAFVERRPVASVRLSPVQTEPEDPFERAVARAERRQAGGAR